MTHIEDLSPATRRYLVALARAASDTGTAADVAAMDPLLKRLTNAEFLQAQAFCKALKHR